MSVRQLFEATTNGLVGPTPNQIVRERLMKVLTAGVREEAAKQQQQQRKNKTAGSSKKH